MTHFRFLLRNLRHYWRTGLAVILGVAVATAVLVGSLAMGDSITGSLRAQALDRLGEIDYVVTPPHFFPDDLGDRLQAQEKTFVRRQSTVSLLRGAVRHASTDAVLPQVNLVGVDKEFWSLYPLNTPAEFPVGRRVAINRALADDLGVTLGDSLLITLERPGAVPSMSLFARRSRSDAFRLLRVQVYAILPHRGPGGFTLDGGTATPRTVFLDREWMMGRLEKRGLANTLLVQVSKHAEQFGVIAGSSRSHNEQSNLLKRVSAAMTLADYGLSLRADTQRRALVVQSDRLVIPTAQLATLHTLGNTLEVRPHAQSMYLAHAIRGKASTYYALLAGVDGRRHYHFAAGGGELTGDGIWLNTWAAQDLGAKVGEKVTVDYLVPSWDGEYRTNSRPFTVRGIVEICWPALDRSMVPPMEGITDADRIDEWAPPFPVDMSQVTDRDEQYWERYRTTPKAFISLDAAKALWASGPEGDRADWVTSVRIEPAAGESITRVKTAVADYLLSRASPTDTGMVFRPVRLQALAAAKGSTDFGQLFLAMSFFLVLAGAGLAAMLMRLNVERRAAEAGVLRAVGWGEAAVRRLLLHEGIALTVIGMLIGLPLGILYAWALVFALATWWAGAITGASVALYLSPLSLGIGTITGLLVGLLAVAWGVKSLTRRGVLDLLAGWQSIAVLPEATKPAGTLLLWALVLLPVCLSFAGAYIPTALIYFLIAAAVLALGLVLCGRFLRQAFTRRGVLTPWHLAVRTAAASRGRSLLVIGLLACAAFIVVTVAANTRDFNKADWRDRRSGTGGFALQATSSLPVYYDFGSSSGRAQLGFPPQDEALFTGVTVVPFLASPGEDISCLNLARPQAPRVLGVPPAFIARGGFTVLTKTKTDKPWQLLERAPAEMLLPAFGDADSVMWSLHSGLGRKYSYKPRFSNDNFNRYPVHFTDLRFTGLVKSSIFASELLVSEANFRSLFPGVGAPRYFLIETPRGRERAVAEALRRNLGELGLQVRETREVLNGYTRVQNTYLAMFLALGGLGMLLGTAGLAVVLLRNIAERRGEFALMLATGIPPRMLAQILILEHAALLAAGLLCGTVAALIAVIPQLAAVESQVNWLPVGLLLAGLFAVGLLTTTLAARTATGGHLLSALRGE